MIRLFSGSGSQEVQVLEKPIPDLAWEVLKRNVIRLLETRGDRRAAAILKNMPFELRDGKNGFNDEFCVLYYRAPVDRYVAIAQEAEEKPAKSAYQRLAEAVTEAGHYIRFIVLDLASESDYENILVKNPSLAISSDAVQNALADAEQLIHSRGASSGVDRIHTAFHGYLKAVAVKASIQCSDDASVTELFKVLRTKHHALMGRDPCGEEIDRVLRSMAAIVDALNPVRNRASGAHPNDLVLGEAEAMLVINSVKTLLHYLDTRLRETS